MEQQEINHQEWENPNNWTGPKVFSVYFSKKDSRTWVPKQSPEPGWTINLGKPTGVAILYGIMLGVPVLIFLIMLAATI